MNIALLLGSPMIGGTEKQVALLANELKERGYRVTILFLVSRKKLPDACTKVDFGALDQKYLGVRRWNRFVKKVAFSHFLEKRDYDVLHMFNLECIEFGKMPAKRAGLPSILGSIRGIRFAYDNDILKRLKKALKGIRKVSVNAESAGKLLVEKNVCSDKKIIFIRNGISLPELKKTTQIRKEIPCILFVGTLKEVKDPMCFVEAGINILKTGRKCRFVIAGNGPLRSILAERVKASGFNGAFEFLGAVRTSEVPYVLSDIVVSTSLREASSNSILEAMAYGIPVVGTNVGGTGDLMKNIDAGLLVKPQCPEETAQAIQMLLDDVSLRHKLGKAGRSYVAEIHGIDDMVNQHILLYEELAGVR